MVLFEQWTTAAFAPTGTAAFAATLFSEQSDKVVHRSDDDCRYNDFFHDKPPMKQIDFQLDRQ